MQNRQLICKSCLIIYEFSYDSLKQYINDFIYSQQKLITHILDVNVKSQIMKWEHQLNSDFHLQRKQVILLFCMRHPVEDMILRTSCPTGSEPMKHRKIMTSFSETIMNAV